MKNLIKKIYAAVPAKKHVFSVWKSVSVPSERLYKHLHFTGDFNVTVDSDHSFKIRHYGFEVENRLFWSGLSGGWEQMAMSVWCDLVRESRVIFDIGANTGIYSLVAKSLVPDSRVIALEPIERVFEKLESNNNLNGFDIECLRAAASDVDGTATIFDMPGDHTYSSTFHNEIFKSDDAIALEVATVRLDSIIEQKEINKLDLMKIDVEGHEPAVLAGMGRFLHEFTPSILIEILTDEVGAKVKKLIEGLGYSILYIDEETSRICEVEDLRRRNSYNYLLCSAEIAAGFIEPHRNFANPASV